MNFSVWEPAYLYFHSLVGVSTASHTVPDAGGAGLCGRECAASWALEVACRKAKLEGIT